PAPPPPAAAVTRRNPEKGTGENTGEDTDNGPGRKPENKSDQRLDSDTAARASASPANIPAADAPAISPPTALNEVEAVLQELQRMNRGLVLTALEDAQKVEYNEGVLQVNFAGEDLFARRLRDSNTLFRDIGERLFGRPLRVEVRIESVSQTEQVDEAELARRKLHERAMNNPAVRRLLEQTRGEIVWVKEN
ncbi:MAG: hypothetical protein J2P31_10700, partial [Blastocatellia bacterium]|nr:hypothetical protein [Blastocatellia bacterium]